MTYLTTKMAQSVNGNNGNLRVSQTCDVFLRLVTMKHHKPLYNAFVYITYIQIKVLQEINVHLIIIDIKSMI